MTKLDEHLMPQFLRFLIAGLLNTAFSYSLFAVLTLLGLKYPVAIAFATLAGVIFNFQTSGKFVFRNAQQSKILRFSFVYVAVYCLNVLGVSLLLHFGANIYLANALLVLPLALLAYLLQRKWVFQTL